MAAFGPKRSLLAWPVLAEELSMALPRRWVCVVRDSGVRVRIRAPIPGPDAAHTHAPQALASPPQTQHDRPLRAGCRHSTCRVNGRLASCRSSEEGRDASRPATTPRHAAKSTQLISPRGYGGLQNSTSRSKRAGAGGQKLRQSCLQTSNPFIVRCDLR